MTLNRRHLGRNGTSWSASPKPVPADCIGPQGDVQPGSLLLILTTAYITLAKGPATAKAALEVCRSLQRSKYHISYVCCKGNITYSLVFGDGSAAYSRVHTMKPGAAERQQAKSTGKQDLLRKAG